MSSSPNTHRPCLTPNDLSGAASSDTGQPFVVFADDYPAVAEAMSRLLEDCCRVSAPIHDLALLRSAVDFLEHLVLVTKLDFGGVSALPDIRELIASHHHLWVIAYSGRDDSLTRENAELAGAADFVGKLEESTMIFAAIKRGWQTVRVDGPIPRDPDPSGQSVRSSHHSAGHDHGPLISWCLRSHFKQRRIAEVLGVSSTTVEYWSRRLHDESAAH